MRDPAHRGSVFHCTPICALRRHHLLEYLTTCRSRAVVAQVKATGKGAYLLQPDTQRVPYVGREHGDVRRAKKNPAWRGFFLAGEIAQIT